MQKGEYIISVALAITVVLTVLVIQRKWQPASLKDVASSAGGIYPIRHRGGG